jgi:hypothetical protein
MSTELLPCPFCPCTPSDLAFADGSTFRWLAWSCPGCGIGSETRVQTMGDGTKEQWLEEAKARARVEWNTRFFTAEAKS